MTIRALTDHVAMFKMLAIGVRSSKPFPVKKVVASGQRTDRTPTHVTDRRSGAITEMLSWWPIDHYPHQGTSTLFRVYIEKHPTNVVCEDQHRQDLVIFQGTTACQVNHVRV